MNVLTFRRITCFTLLVLTCPRSTMGQERFINTQAARIEMLLKDNFADSSAGMVIGLLDEHGSRVFSAGKMDNGTNQEVNGDTLFEIGSITKTFTALLLLDMVRRGEMKLDDPVAKYLPREIAVTAHEANAITLLNLAVQDSGLPFNPDNFSDEHWVDAYNAYATEDLYAFLKSYKAKAVSGAGFQYSNVGMTLLGHVIERQSGADYESLVLSRICRPLKMDDTLITLAPQLTSRVAMGHDKDGKHAPKYILQVMAPAGALLSTANDLLKYLSANLGIMRTDLYPLMKEMQVIRYRGSPPWGKTAMPWFDEGVYNPPGSELLGHAGGSPGCASFIGFDLIKRRGVVVLSNQTMLRPAAIGWKILQDMPLTTDNWLVRETVGIGTALNTDEKAGMVRITKVFPKSPAGRAGLSAGLMIQKINGNAVKGKSLQECLGIMAGPAGTKVQLEIVDPQSQQTKSVELTKQKFLTLSS